MLFNSLEFLIFFPVVTGVFFLLKHVHRWKWLLATSCFFYMFFKPEYILILLFTIIIDYYAARGIEKTENGRAKKTLLIISLCSNILVLGLFKYYNFINDNISAVLSIIHIENPIPALTILLPIGLSFHTFQAMSYIIEVYRGNQIAERHFGYYALYVMFYPQLVAGPIERPQNILFQFHEEKYFDYNNLRHGLKLMIYGFFKKVVIADNVAQIVNEVYANHTAESLTCFVAMLLFSVQIYCDFSGYSDIAIGSARCMGYDLMRNFSLPYHAQSITDFWRRWHISLSTWFRDYLYIPLGGKKSSIYRSSVNLLVVFIISGLWHGANWNYILWGSLHAGLLILEKVYLLKVYKRIPLYFLIPFNYLVISCCWLLFRVEDFDKLSHIITSILHLPAEIKIASFSQAFYTLGGIKFLPILTLICFFMLVDKYFNKILYTDSANEYSGSKVKFYEKYQFQFLVAITLVFGFFGQIQFIYFQF